MKNSVRQYFGKMKLYFRVGYGLFALFFIMFNILNESRDKYDSILILMVIISIASIIIYLYYLGKLVDIYNKSRIVWIGGAFITAPFGPIVAYFKMSNIVKNEIETHKDHIN